MENAQEILQLVERRHELDANDLSEHIRQNWGGSLLTLRQLEPFVSEILRRFKCLPRKRQVNGDFARIAGHRSFKSWYNGVLNRKERSVRYMLAKSKAASDESRPRKTDSQDSEEVRGSTAVSYRAFQTERRIIGRDAGSGHNNPFEEAQLQWGTGYEIWEALVPKA
jgi:hypothetical protein